MLHPVPIHVVVYSRSHALHSVLIHSKNMKEIAAYVLLVLGGNATPSAADVTKLLTTAGAEANADDVAKIIAGMEGKNVMFGLRN